MNYQVPNAIKIVFEDENAKQGHRETWELLTHTTTEKSKLIQIIRKKWKNLFKLDLAIKHL